MGYNPRKRLLETRLPEEEFIKKLRISLSGSSKNLDKVIWAASENEVLVHLDKLQVAVQTGKIIVGLQMECDQFGVQELVLPFMVGDVLEQSYLLAVLPTKIGGHQGLARTWGDIAAKFVWQACLDALHLKWQEEDGLEHFSIKGLLTKNGLVQGLFAYPDKGDIREDDEQPVKDVADLVDSLELAQIHLGQWAKRKITLKPVAVHKVKGRVKSVKFDNGAVMDGAEVAALIKEKKVTVDTVVAVKRKGKLFLRGTADKSATDLLDLPPIYQK